MLCKLRIQFVRQLFHCGIGIDIAHGDIGGIYPVANGGTEPRHQQGMRAEVVEEVIVNGDLRQFQGFSQCRSNQSFGLGARCEFRA